MQLKEPQLGFSFTQPECDVLRVKAKPFMKWAGGKGQLIAQFESFFPPQVREGKLVKYAEPFIGGGALFFYLAQNYNIQESFISDQNKHLILAYLVIQQQVEELICQLEVLQKSYYQLDPEKQKLYFYQVRELFNQNTNHNFLTQINQSAIQQVVYLIFLNRTCFNGLYRVNSKGKFNVPFGGYENPAFFEADNLRAISLVLQRTKIVWGDFEQCCEFVDDKTFVYFDPPYRPLNKTSGFTSYVDEQFNDHEQKRLALFCRQLHQKGAYWMVSNSDPYNEDPTDNFFQELYAGFNIATVLASRNINSNGQKRGKISELLITNY